MRELKIGERFTYRSENIERYFNDLNKESLFSIQEESEVAVRAANGDVKAIDELVKANLRFVVSVAKQYSSNSEILGELIAQGNIGLIDAAKTFDPSRGFKFISYAVWHIRKEIMLYLNSSSRSVRVPTNIILTTNRAKKVESELANKLSREISIEEIAEEMTLRGWPITPEKLTLQMAAVQRSIPLESSNPDEEWSPIQWLESDLTPSDRDDQDIIIAIKSAMSVLSPSEKEIVKMVNGIPGGEPISFRNIGEMYGKSSEWARNKYNKAIRKTKSRALRLGLKNKI